MTAKAKLLMTLAICSVIFTGCIGGSKKDPVDHVYMYIGTINPKTRGATPVIKTPGGTIGLFPSFNPGMTDMYFSDKIFGFPLGIGSLMVTAGEVSGNAASNASRFDHDHETATPYYYQALLEDPNVNAEFTTTDNTVLFRFTLPANQTSNLILSLTGDADVEMNGNVIKGTSLGTGRNAIKNYFYAELSQPLSTAGTFEGRDISKGNLSLTGRNIGAFASYPTTTDMTTLEVKVGLSTESIEKAQAFLNDEIGSQTFDQVKKQSRKRWNDELGLIKIKGGTEKQRDLFYTTLHRTRALRMGNVWDTYRGAYPLQALLHPEENTKTINSWLKRYDDYGWIPSSGAMIGHHSTSVIVDSYLRGVRGFDVEKAYEGMKKNHLEATMIPWKDSMYITELEQCYFDNGYYPALPVKPGLDPQTYAQQPDKYMKLPYQTYWLPEVGVEEWVKEVDPWHRRQSISVTLEHAYDDWCLAQMAKELGKQEDYELFMKRAHNYQNLYKESIGLMAPKDADGNWIEPFDPKYSGGFAGEGYFAEGNSWYYTWHVQHDIQGLINLMGGNEKFVDKLNELFVTRHSMDKLQFLAQQPDMTGLMGMFPMGNEPAFHIPYLFNYAGQPWLTQNKVRQVLELWFDTTPFGLSGDEDGGAMSSVYVLGSMGIYPQCPGNPIFDIGSPLFDEVEINVGNGKKFMIETKNNSAQNKYIQSATLNGKPYNKLYITHQDILNGGKIVFEMGPRPNKSWGVGKDAVAPSMSTPI